VTSDCRVAASELVAVPDLAMKVVEVLMFTTFVQAPEHVALGRGGRHGRRAGVAERAAAERSVSGR
jgi:hypothetical protein